MVRITVGTGRIPKKELGLSPAVLDMLARSDSREILLYVARHPSTRERTRETVMYERGLGKEAIETGIGGRDSNGHSYAGGKDPHRMSLDERSEWMRGNRLITLMGSREFLGSLIRDAKRDVFYSADRLRDIETACRINLDGRDRNAIEVVARARSAIASDPELLRLLSDDAYRTLKGNLAKDMALLARRE
ncbi:MAG: hypothetical protein KGH50_03095 [Candidatus Micrarchaeota archaeon]|nr:hypothetical protein [Candidatus Micrarchaeota archaeon]